MTSRSRDAENLDRAFRNLIDRYRSPDYEIGAGQRATKVHGLEILRFEARLGIPLYPAEPISQVIAALGQNYEFHTWLLSLWQPIEHPIADLRIDAIGADRALIRDYMEELLPREIPGIYTQALNADQLEELLTEPAMPEGRVDYAALKERINIVDYIGRFMQLKRMGSRYKGICPFHQEKNESFVVYTDTKSYYCFGCGASGDVIDFARAAHGTLPQLA
jgi:hypothetical protein